MELVLKNDTLCASEFDFDQLNPDDPFTVMTIAGRVERGDSKVVNVRFEPKPTDSATGYKAELKLNYYHGTATILLKGRATNDKRYSVACNLYN